MQTCSILKPTSSMNCFTVTTIRVDPYHPKAKVNIFPLRRFGGKYGPESTGTKTFDIMTEQRSDGTGGPDVNEGTAMTLLSSLLRQDKGVC